MLQLSGVVSAALCALLFSACAVAPTEQDVRTAATRYFESRGYRVIEVKTGAIQAIPLGEKTYMGTPTYNVQLTSLTLVGPEGAKKLKTFSLSTGIIRLRERPGERGIWEVAGVSGISLP